MGILRYHFRILSICGCWRPSGWTSPHQIFAYYVYMIFVMAIIYSNTIFQFIDYVMNIDKEEALSDNFYKVLLMVGSCCKMYFLVMKRVKIENLTRNLIEEPFAPMNTGEIEIYKKYDDKAQTSIINNTICVEATVVVVIFSSLMVDFNNRELIFNAWTPYNYSSLGIFTLAESHQAVGFILGALMHVACDCTVCGMMVHVCCQIDILAHRLKNVTGDGKQSLKICARHHDHIYRFAAQLNSDFTDIIFIQFSMSTSVMCFVLYQFSQNKGFSPEFIEVLFYLMSVMVQIFLYCWYGNEVKVKSPEIINVAFGFSWTTLDNGAKKMLVMIMRRALIPIEFTSGAIISLNLDSYVNFLKTAYSVFNMLQQM